MVFISDVSHMSSPDERIAVIQKQLIELRKIYLQLKSEVSSIDRRRKRFRRKEREGEMTFLVSNQREKVALAIWISFIHECI